MLSPHDVSTSTRDDTTTGSATLDGQSLFDMESIEFVEEIFVEDKHSENDHADQSPADCSCRCVSSDEDQSVVDGTCIEVEVFTLGGSCVRLSVPKHASVSELLHLVKCGLKAPPEEFSLVLGEALLDDPYTQPFLELANYDVVKLQMVMRQPPICLELWFDSMDAHSWEARLQEVEDCCVLELRVGNCARFNLKYWRRLAELLGKHGHKVRGLKVRQSNGYLHPDAVRALAIMLPPGLRTLDLSWVLPGSWGLELMSEALPSSLESLLLVGCVDDGKAFGPRVLELLPRLKLLRQLYVTGFWIDEHSAFNAIRATAPSFCEVIVS
jgi:hypothetical protein